MNGRAEQLQDIAKAFFKLGTLAFGGPAAHIAMMEEEFVVRRQWLSHSRFLDLIGASNLIPGPTSTELAIYLGYQRAGWAGLVTAGSCFILPAMMIVMFFAYLYVTYGTMPQLAGVLYGVKPVIMAVIISALWNMGKSAIKGVGTVLCGLVAMVLSIGGYHPLVVIIVCGLLVVVVNYWHRLIKPLNNLTLGFIPVAGFSLPVISPPVLETMSLTALFFTFLKIGSVLYGSGYVLLAFLWSDFVDMHILTAQQLLDAVTVGQFTPGPVFTTATFIGYLIAGLPGAVVATVAIFLPAFAFVPLVHSLLHRLRQSKGFASFLDGVTMGSVVLMAVVSWRLGQSSLVDWPTLCVAVGSFVLLRVYQMNSTWLILAGACIGFIDFM